MRACLARVKLSQDTMTLADRLIQPCLARLRERLADLRPPDGLALAADRASAG
jgi:hypothetical protein